MDPSRRTVLISALAAACPAAAFAAPGPDPFQEVLDYAAAQKTTGLLVIRDGRTLVRRNWPLPPDARLFRAAFAYETNAAGELLEDVASQQKSFVSVLLAIAVDRGLLEVERPVADIIGPGWSKATRDQEAAIRVLDVMTMSSGLKENFTWAAPPGTRFLYNTPVFAVTKRVLAAVAKAPLDAVTRDWLTAPAGMADTSWRQRPAALGGVGNPTGLITSPSDVARLGQIVLDGGRAADGRRIVSEAGLRAMFERSTTNPAYGRFWWLNGSAFTIRPLDKRVDGPLIPSAPPDLVAALGALDRKLYVCPAQRLVVVRLGQAAPDPGFDETLWRKLSKALALPHAA